MPHPRYVVMGQSTDGTNSTTVVGATSSRSVTCTSTIGSKVLTSSAAFLETDVGAEISGTGIPANSIIDSFTSTSSVTFKAAPDLPDTPDPTATTTGSASRTIRDGYAGEWVATESKGVVRELVVVGSTVTSGLGGTFAFQFGADGTSAVINEVRAIDDFATVRDFDLINAGQFFRVLFAPDRDLTAGEVYFITTTLRRQHDGSFVRLANQQIEESNAAMGQTFSYLKAFVAETGKSINVRANKGEALLTAAFQTEVALGHITGYEVNTKFGRVKNIDAADAAVDIWAFADDTASPRSNTKTFPAAADTIYLTSSSASDTAVDFTVEYIDSTGAEATATDVTLTGQTPVSIGATGFDVNRLRNSGSTASVGTIYASVGNDFTGGSPNDVTDILAVAPAGYEQSQLSHFTVPLGKTLVMRSLLITVSRASGSGGSADVTLRIKEFGGVSRIRREFFPTNSTPITNGIQDLVVPARAQIVWRLDDVSDGDTSVSCVWGYELIDD